MILIGLDLGTSFIKGAVLDLAALSISNIRRLPFPGPVAHLPERHYEVDPQAIVEAVRDLLAQLIPHAPNCAGIMMCSQMHGLVLTSPQGQPLSNCITWQDQRALENDPEGPGTFFDQINDSLSDDDKRALGNELKPSLPLCALYWLKQNQQLPAEPFTPATLPDFVLAQLETISTGTTTAPHIERTNAGAHGGLNLHTLDWHWPVFERLGLADLSWPTIVPWGSVVSTINIAGKELPCYTPIGDHQCALAGAFLEVGDLSLNVATASQVSMLTDRLQLGEQYQTRAFFDDRYLNTVIRIPAGRSLDRLIGLLSELALAQGVHLENPWPYIVAEVEKVAETDLVVDLSFFASAVGSQGQISRIREEQLTIGHIFKAAFAHMAANYEQCARRLSTPDRWQQLVFSGGLAQKIEPLQQLIIDRFKLPYRVCASDEDTLLGLLALALVFCGQKPSLMEAVRHLRQHMG